MVSGAEFIWTGKRELAGADVLCRDGVVVGVGNGSGRRPSPDGPDDTSVATSSSAERLDASGCVVIPGLVNAHHHLLQSAFRTLEGTRHVRMDRWLAVMGGYYRHARVDPELTAAAAAVGIAEGLLAGVTTVADHHLTWPDDQDSTELAAATIAAAADLGSRLVFVRG
ncbi:MAG: amidohydrolase family protein, partial [Acidimicrobiia bacterium]|nr:amidohydrolase family protein [Acidimicrobiia bacterium]